MKQIKDRARKIQSKRPQHEYHAALLIHSTSVVLDYTHSSVALITVKYLLPPHVRNNKPTILDPKLTSLEK